MRDNGFPMEVQTLAKPIVEATLEVFAQSVTNLLPTPAKSHYTYVLTHHTHTPRPRTTPARHTHAPQTCITSTHPTKTSYPRVTPQLHMRTDRCILTVASERWCINPRGCAGSICATLRALCTVC